MTPATLGKRVAALEKLPAGLRLVANPSGSEGVFLELGSGASSGTTASFGVAKCARWLALARGGDPYWQGPDFGEDMSKVPQETQFLLWERTDGLFGICLPLIAGDTRVVLEGSSGGLRLRYGGALSVLPLNTPRRRVAYVVTGTEPYALIDSAMRAVQALLGTFRLREEKTEPEMLDYLGWGTWDAFKQSIDAKRLARALRSFHEAGIRLGFVLLDDGWQDVSGDYLNDFAVNAKKFPKGLKHSIAQAKAKYGVRLFGCWFAFEGYWAGLNPRGPLAKRFRTVSNTNVIRPWLKPPPKQALHLVHPDEVHRFYAEFLRLLSSEGVDLVKVDGQSALELFTVGTLGRVSTMRSFQEGLQGAAAVHMRGNLLHCMCNGSDVLYHLKHSSLWRNSQDYFPGHEVAVQQRHVVQNAYNNVWLRSVAWPDWDFFQSHRPEGTFHAAARAISGGPVYFDDETGKADAVLLNRLTTSDGRLLRCREPAWVAPDCLFVDVRKAHRLLRVVNRNRVGGLVGVFHCREGAEVIKERVRLLSGLDLKGKRCAVYSARSAAVEALTPRSKKIFELQPMQWDLLTVVPIQDGLAPLGLLEKLNSGAGILSWRRLAPGAWAGLFRDGGRLGFFCEKEVSAIHINGRLHRGAKVTDSGLLVVESPNGDPVEITVKVTGD
ncbi:MAG: Sip1-related alpha-galactosidase [Opitutales bacterium]